jgi:hypothetical protein
MLDPTKTTRYTFVIDTDHYAGNFERELLARITGLVCDDHAGTEGIANLAKQEMGERVAELFENLLEQRFSEHDDSSWLSYADLVPTPGLSAEADTDNVFVVSPSRPFIWPVYNSVGFFLSRMPTKHEIDMLKIRTTDLMVNNKFEGRHVKEQIKLKGFRLIEETLTLRFTDL